MCKLPMQILISCCTIQSTQLAYLNQAYSTKRNSPAESVEIVMPVGGVHVSL